MFKKIKAVAYGIAGSAIVAIPAMATPPAWYEGVTFDTTSVTTLAGLALTALGVIWAIRKAIKLMGRS